jgi:hypothetical protein
VARSVRRGLGLAGKAGNAACWLATLQFTQIVCLADSGYQGLSKIHKNSETPTKKSKKHPLTAEQKEKNRSLSSKRIFCEHVIGKLKIFRILKERYRNRRKRFGLRFNLISALYNLALVAR